MNTNVIDKCFFCGKRNKEMAIKPVADSMPRCMNCASKLNTDFYLTLHHVIFTLLERVGKIEERELVE